MSGGGTASTGLASGAFDGTSGTAGLIPDSAMSSLAAGDGAAANAAMTNGTAGSAGGAAAAATQNIPQWQKGLMGLVTGDSQYGKNAPQMHAMLTKGLGMAGQGGRPAQGGMQMPPMAGGPPPQMTAPSPGMAPSGMPPQPMGGGAPMQQPQQGQAGMQPPNPLQGMNPQMLAALKQQYPQLFAQGGMGQ